ARGPWRSRRAAAREGWRWCRVLRCSGSSSRSRPRRGALHHSIPCDCLVPASCGTPGDMKSMRLTVLPQQAVPMPLPGAGPEVEHGCPFDCGACSSHQQKVRLPVVPITSACNLDCPICYTINKNEGAYHMGPDELGRILDHLREDHGEIDIINFTGGEPTVHP